MAVEEPDGCAVRFLLGSLAIRSRREPWARQAEASLHTRFDAAANAHLTPGTELRECSQGDALSGLSEEEER